jgi:DNA polymerase-1
VSRPAAIYGFARKLLSVLKEYKPDYVAVAFDLGDTWRHSRIQRLQSHPRLECPMTCARRWTRIEQLLNAFSIPIVTYPNYEADDVLGTLARQAALQATDVLIMSGDRDMFQLVDDRVKILYTSGGPNPVTSVMVCGRSSRTLSVDPAAIHRLQGVDRR